MQTSWRRCRHKHNEGKGDGDDDVGPTIMSHTHIDTHGLHALKKCKRTYKQEVDKRAAMMAAYCFRLPPPTNADVDVRLPGMKHYLPWTPVSQQEGLREKESENGGRALR